MIKKGVILNPKLKEAKQGELNTELILLQEALTKRNELAEKYKKAGTNINPLLLIQLPSDSKKISQDDCKIKQLVTDYLTTKEITEKNNRFAVWLSEEKINLDDISKDDSIVEVLLFKQAIALGWDCPRAAILLIYREMKQETFTVQTLGRILRMPEQKHYADESLNIGYVFTNLQRDFIKIITDDLHYITFNKATRKSDYKNINLNSFYTESNINRNRIGLHFREALFKIAESRWNISRNSENSESFYFSNKEQVQLHGIVMDTGNIEIAIPTDVNIDVTHEGQTTVKEKAKFAKTLYELEQLFNRYCISNCGEYAKDGSWERIKYHLKVLFAEYFGYSESETYKVILHNEQKYTDLLNLAREEYGKIMTEKAKSKIIDIKEQFWEVPEFRIYNNNYINYDVEKHILDPLFIRKKSDGTLTDSKNEFDFICFLEKNKENIFWWYKNGVGNRADFAIPYLNTQNKNSLFYVDFVILFKNGTLGLFDPKTPESDKDMIAKHNALIDYINERNIKEKSTTGGIILNKGGSWRYSKGKINNAYDVTGWTILDPALITVKS
jgi:type III restriction enzyme